jgi:maltooligosyltrehalose trehalohydrolase
MQNHDQVGNRAKGDRSSALMSVELVKVAAALVLTSPFVPLLFQGEEWGATTPFLYFTDHVDAELGRAVADGRRREFVGFGWDPDDIPDPQDGSTFEASRLDWAELGDPAHADILEWHRRLIALRASAPELSRLPLDATTTAFDENARWLAVVRGPLTIVCNFGPEPAAMPVGSPGPGELVLASSKEPEPGTGVVTLAPESATVYRR